MALCKGWINIYRSGFFHTPGKPGAYNRHPGDIYATEATALADIKPRRFYVTTIPIQWEEKVLPPVNPRVNDIPAQDVSESLDGNHGAYLWLQEDTNVAH
jgi:hypothetical protein